MEIYSGDPLLKYIKGGKLQTCVQSNISDEEMSEMTFGEILKALCEKGVDEKVTSLLRDRKISLMPICHCLRKLKTTIIWF